MPATTNFASLTLQAILAAQFLQVPVRQGPVQSAVILMSAGAFWARTGIEVPPASPATAASVVALMNALIAAYRTALKSAAAGIAQKYPWYIDHIRCEAVAAGPELRERWNTLAMTTEKKPLRPLPYNATTPAVDAQRRRIALCGPKGYPGMPEVGNMPLPRKLLELGVEDMLRISDARMSGTAFGAVVLHVAPESEAGGPLAMVRNGDEILFDGPKRRFELLISPEELTAQGCDLDFLTGASGSVVDRESH